MYGISLYCDGGVDTACLTREVSAVRRHGNNGSRELEPKPALDTETNV